jgi:hypothetical protein
MESKKKLKQMHKNLLSPPSGRGKSTHWPSVTERHCRSGGDISPNNVVKKTVTCHYFLPVKPITGYAKYVLQHIFI